MLMSLPVYLGLDQLQRPLVQAVAGWLSLALALPVVIFSASDFWRAAWFGPPAADVDNGISDRAWAGGNLRHQHF